MTSAGESNETYRITLEDSDDTILANSADLPDFGR